jgi:hypothetical protein
MKLTDKEVLEDAQNLVLDTCTGLEELKLEGQAEIDAYSDAQRIFEMSSKILSYMVRAGHETIH